MMLLIMQGVNGQIILDSHFEKLEITSDCQYYLDSSFATSIDDILQEKLPFSAINHSILNLGFYKGNVWLRFDAENYSTKHRHLYLVLSNKVIESASLYEIKDKSVEKASRSGFAIAYDEKHVKDDLPVFRFELWPHQSKRIYIKLSSRDFALWQHLSLLSDSYYQNRHAARIYINGIYYGLVLMLLLMNFFYFITLKRKSFLYFIFYQFAVILYLTSSDGMIFHVFLTSVSKGGLQLYFIANILPQLAILPFTSVSLRLKQYYPLYRKILFAHMAVISLFLAYSVLGESLPFKLLNILTLATVALIAFISVRSLKHKDLKMPVFFLASVIVLIVLIIPFLLRNIGVLSIGFNIEYLKAGFVLQLLIISIGLSLVFKKYVRDASKEAIENLENLNRVKDDLNSRLEICVGERTVELDNAITDLNRVNVKMLDINRKLEEERDKFENQKEILEQQKKELTDSIDYARRLQKTLMTTDDDLSALFDSKYFVLSMPKDLISGDFYWAGKVGGKLVLTVADCTGHGVPGAFMSVIGITYLREIVENSKVDSAAEILGMLRKRVVESFQKHIHNESFPKDGMDLALVVIDQKKKMIDYAGAFNPLYFIRSSVLTTYRADHLPIGIDERNGIPYKSTFIEYKTGDMVYLFSDGYVDQFGWRNGKKFKARQFRELLLDIYELPLEVQKTVLKNSIKNWKGDLEQVDDITIIGLRLE